MSRATNPVSKAFALIGAALLAACLALAMSAANPDDAYAYEQRESIVASGHGYNNAQYLVIHETANPGASAYNHTIYWRNNPAYAVHYVMELDGSVVYHTMYDDRNAWHVGNGNYQTVGIELAHAISQSQFDNQWNEAVKWAGDYLKSRGWGIDRLLSHDECRMIWGGTDHTDPTGYFAQYGRSWSQFEAAVADYMGTGYAPSGGQTTTAPSNGASSYQGSGFGGTYTCMAGSLNVRTGPGLGYGAVASYSSGQTVNLDDWYAIADGYVWGRYTSYSGSVRYVAVGRATGQVEPDDYLVKGGSAPSYSAPSGVSGAGTYTVTASSLNIRDGIWGGIVGSLPYGYTLHVSGIQDGWAYYTAYSGNVRWVSADYLAA